VLPTHHANNRPYVKPKGGRSQSAKTSRSSKNRGEPQFHQLEPHCRMAEICPALEGRRLTLGFRIDRSLPDRLPVRVSRGGERYSRVQELNRCRAVDGSRSHYQCAKSSSWSAPPQVRSWRKVKARSEICTRSRPATITIMNSRPDGAGGSKTYSPCAVPACLEFDHRGARDVRESKAAYCGRTEWIVLAANSLLEITGMHREH
jgi:hypothetical protein